MAPVVRLLDADPQVDHRLVVTAQHRELLDEVLQLFELTPDYDLNLMQDRQSLDYLTAGALEGLGKVLDEVRPDFMLVHGDTTTTFVGALAAFYRQIPVGHVEAGLRTSTVTEPFPEELNRRITDLVSAQYYCPTEGAAANLRGCPEHTGEILVTGNTALDAVRLVHDPNFNFPQGPLVEFAGHPGPKLLITAHRRENWGRPLALICHGLLAALADFPDAMACFCWHPNPVVRETVGPLLQGQPRILLCDPPRFDTFVNLMARCDMLLTDSGGIQEEISQLRRFALVLRAETERPEAIEAGFAQLVKPDTIAVRDAVGKYLPQCLSGEIPGSNPSPFGDGHAAQRIVSAIKEKLNIG